MLLMASQTRHRTGLVTVRLLTSHIEALKALPQGESASSIVRAYFDHLIDGKEIPINIRALRPKLREAVARCSQSVARASTTVASQQNNGSKPKG